MMRSNLPDCEAASKKLGKAAQRMSRILGSNQDPLIMIESPPLVSWKDRAKLS